MEFELGEEVLAAAADAEEAAADVAMGQAAEVEDNAAVQAVAEGPAVEAGSRLADIQAFINDNPYGKALWSFAKFAATTTAGASAVWAIMYGLNKAIAKNAHDTGNRTGLTDYLASVAATYAKNGLKFTDDLKQKAAEDALAFPWIDSSK